MDFNAFQAVFVSDTTDLVYARNTAVCFQAEKPHRLLFDGTWKVALICLCFPKYQSLARNNETNSDTPQHIWVHADFVEATPIGSDYQPLLAICPYKSSGIHHFSNPIYIPIRERDAYFLELQLKTDVGQLYPFEHGRTVAVLQFKREW